MQGNKEMDGHLNFAQNYAICINDVYLVMAKQKMVQKIIIMRVLETKFEVNLTFYTICTIYIPYIVSNMWK